MREQSPSHARFRAELDKIPIMDAQTERAELERYAAGDKEAGRRVVAGNIRIALTIARGFAGKNQTLYEELAAVAMEGLTYALTKFDPSMGTRFISYAKAWCVVRIQRHMNRVRRIVTTPHNGPTYEAVRAMHRDRPENIEELAEVAKVTVEQATVAWHLAFSPDAYLGHHDALGPTGIPVATLGTQRADEAMYTLADPTAAMDWRGTSHAVRLAVMRLDQREQAIARRRLMVDDPCTLQEIATDYGVCRERIRQIEKRVVRKLREALAQYREAA